MTAKITKRNTNVWAQVFFWDDMNNLNELPAIERKSEEGRPDVVRVRVWYISTCQNNDSRKEKKRKTMRMGRNDRQYLDYGNYLIRLG
jgi:hypothetical protein